MHPIIATVLSSLPADTDTPRTHSFEIPESFNVDRDTLRFNVHIRTNTKGYLGGWSTDSAAGAREAWDADCKNLMSEIGFEKNKGWFFPSDGTQSEYLYAHPDDISGVITLPKALMLHAAIERGDYGISNRNIDVYEVFEELTNDELAQRLKYYYPTIRNRMLEAFQTTRKTKFKSYNGLATADLPGLNLLTDKASGVYGTGVKNEFIRHFVDGIKEQLVQDGLLLTYQKDSQTFYRTANKTEQRAMKRSVKSDVYCGAL